MLKDAYFKANQTEDYIKELRLTATELMPGNIDVFREYKQQVPGDQWPEKREEIFSVRDAMTVGGSFSPPPCVYAV